MSRAATFEDCFNMLCGEKLGEGIHREVFACKLRPELVVKIERQEMRYFANVMENNFWAYHQSVKEIARWLAPCEFLSPDGRLSLMRRADPVPSKFKLPDKLPTFLTDLKRSNFGLLDGRLVCVDYAFTIPNPSMRLRKANW